MSEVMICDIHGDGEPCFFPKDHLDDHSFNLEIEEELEVLREMVADSGGVSQ